MPAFKQRDRSDCGACCLGFVAAHYRHFVSVARLRQLAGTNRQGSTALGLVEAARQLGFSAKGVKGNAEEISHVPLPAIAHCLTEKGLLHYIVLISWRPRYARVMDPATGRIERWPRDKFLSIWSQVLILLAPGSQFKVEQRATSPAARLWSLLRPHRGILLQAFIGAVVSTVLALSTSVYVQKIVDSVIPEGNRQLLNLLGLSMLLVLAFRVVLGVCQSLLSLRTAQKIDASLMLAYYRHLLRLPQPFFDGMRVGEITSRVADAVKIRNFLNNTVLSLLLYPLILVFAFTALFFYSWKLALLSLALVPPNLALYWITNRFNRACQRTTMERAAEFDAQLVESLTAHATIRRFGLEWQAELKTETRLVRLLRATWRAAAGGLGMNTAGTVVSQGFQIALLWVGASLVLSASLTPGELMSCYTLAGFLTGPIAGLISLNSSIQEALVATDRLFELMDLELEKDGGTLDLAGSRPCSIRFMNVRFKYPGRSVTLDNVTVTCAPGKITIIAGESGCGKSTLLSLLQRLYPVESGRILIGEHDISYYALSGLRRALAVVPQATTLLSGTVIENLVPDAPEPDMERVLQLCRDTGAIDFIEKLPQGFLTPLNENGSNLSGGQRQRIALVRALCRDAPILLLDEPSAAFDPKSEEMLISVLLRERDRGRTIVVASHSPQLLAIADETVMMSGGTIASRFSSSAADRPGRPSLTPALEIAVA